MAAFPAVLFSVFRRVMGIIYWALGAVVFEEMSLLMDLFDIFFGIFDSDIAVIVSLFGELSSGGITIKLPLGGKEDGGSADVVVKAPVIPSIGTISQVRRVHE